MSEKDNLKNVDPKEKKDYKFQEEVCSPEFSEDCIDLTEKDLEEEAEEELDE